MSDPRERASDFCFPCPFCGEGEFDHNGLKMHLEGTAGLFSGPCDAYEVSEEISNQLYLITQGEK